MKYLKKFNESLISSNPDLEDKLIKIIESIESSKWASINEWEFSDKEINSKKELFEDIEIKNIIFTKCENKLNKLCYDLTEFIYSRKFSFEFLKQKSDNHTHEVFDIQVTYDIRGIIVMSGLLTDNPKILDIFDKDLSIDDIELKIVSRIIENIIKYSEIKPETKKTPIYKNEWGRNYSKSDDLDRKILWKYRNDPNWKEKSKSERNRIENTSLLNKLKGFIN
jgi:hypothetical protein